MDEALDGDAAHIEFADALSWYRSPQNAFQEYRHYLEDRSNAVRLVNRRYAQSPQFVRDLEHDVPGAVPGP